MQGDTETKTGKLKDKEESRKGGSGWSVARIGKMKTKAKKQTQREEE